MGAQGGGKHPIIVQQFPSERVAAAIRHTPAHALIGAICHLELAGSQLGEKLLLAAFLLRLQLRVKLWLAPAPRIHHAEKVPPQAGFRGGVEGEGDHPPGQGALKEGSQPRAHTGGIHHHGARVPGQCQVAHLAVQPGVAYARPLAAQHRNVRGQGLVSICRVHTQQGEGGAVARRVERGYRSIHAAHAFILTGHVQQQGVGTALQRGCFGSFAGAQSRQAVGREEAAGAIHLLGKVLRAHGRVRAPKALNGFLHVPAVSAHLGAHFVCGEAENTAYAVAFFLGSGAAQLLGKQGTAGPRGAPEDARGVGGGSHGRHVFLVLDAQHILGFVHLQQG